MVEEGHDLQAKLVDLGHHDEKLLLVAVEHGDQICLHTLGQTLAQRTIGQMDHQIRDAYHALQGRQFVAKIIDLVLLTALLDTLRQSPRCGEVGTELTVRRNLELLLHLGKRCASGNDQLPDTPVMLGEELEADELPDIVQKSRRVESLRINSRFKVARDDLGSQSNVERVRPEGRCSTASPVSKVFVTDTDSTIRWIWSSPR